MAMGEGVEAPREVLPPPKNPTERPSRRLKVRQSLEYDGFFTVFLSE
jgi:hypothetical protein